MAVVAQYQYPAVREASMPDWRGLGISAEASTNDSQDVASPGCAVSAPDHMSLPIENQQQCAAEFQRRLEEKRQEGILEGRRAERAQNSEIESAVQLRRIEQTAEQAREFAREHEKLVLDTEHEVVRLALAIAARVLRREVLMDPMMLAGAARVALGQLSKTAKVRLRVPAAEFELWSETMLRTPHLDVPPEILIGEGMGAGECRVESEIGSVDLGIQEQLSEIERGFVDGGLVNLTDSYATESKPCDLVHS
jgi:flagellar assembly protein FliH